MHPAGAKRGVRDGRVRPLNRPAVKVSASRGLPRIAAITTYTPRLRGTAAHPLSENRRALEEKYRHSLASLEHYRNAAKEQREQESRRHAEQVANLLGEVKDLRSRLDSGRKEAAISARKTPRKRTPDA